MNKQLKSNQSGFTLIELVVVIVILGILAATALPKFIDLKSDASTAALNGVAGAVNAAFTVNYAARLVNPTKGVAIAGAAVDVSAAAISVMHGSSMPVGYTATAGASSVACGTTVGLAIPITITNSSLPTGAQSAPATLTCTG